MNSDSEIMKKECSKCGQFLELDKFPIQKNKWRDNICYECRKKNLTKYYGRYKEYAQKNYQEKKEQYREVRRKCSKDFFNNHVHVSELRKQLKSAKKEETKQKLEKYIEIIQSFGKNSMLKSEFLKIIEELKEPGE